MGKTIEEQVVSFLTHLVKPYLIVFFGSASKGTERSDSDVDIAYLSDTHLDEYERFMMSQELASLLNKDVDLVDLNKASTVFQAQIINSGKVIYCDDEKRRMEFEMKTLKMYAKLNEERDVVLKSIGESGSVYEE